MGVALIISAIVILALIYLILFGLGKPEFKNNDNATTKCDGCYFMGKLGVCW